MGKYIYIGSLRSNEDFDTLATISKMISQNGIMDYDITKTQAIIQESSKKSSSKNFSSKKSIKT